MSEETFMSVADRAMRKATHHFEKEGWKVMDVSHIGGSHKGYDLLLERDSAMLKVEVKGSAKPYEGIPDLHSNEVGNNGQLVADILFVCYFPDNLPEKCAILMREDIPSHHLKPKSGYSIAHAIKGRRNIKKFLRDC